VGFVVHAIFAGPGHPASIKIVVDQFNVTSCLVGQKSPVTIQCGIEAFLKHFFRLRSGRAELQHSERPQFGYQFVEERQKLLARSRSLIVFAPLLFITCAREVVKKFLFGDPGRILLDFVFLQRPGNARGFWNLIANGAAVGIQDLVFIGKDRLQWQAIGFLERPLQQRGRLSLPKMVSGANAFEISNIERMNIGAHQPGVWHVTMLHSLWLREITIRKGQVLDVRLPFCGAGGFETYGGGILVVVEGDAAIPGVSGPQRGVSADWLPMLLLAEV
jgi:hypothetical protein